MPVFAEFGAAPQVGYGKHATVFQPQIAVSHKARGQADVESAVSGQKGRVLAVKRQAFFVKHEHGHARTIFRVEPDLLDFITGRIDSWSVNFAPQRGAPPL